MKRTAVGLLFVLCIAGAAQASLVVYEPFQGYTAGVLNTRVPNANTVGLDTATAYTGHTAFQAQNTGLTFSDIQTNGGSMLVTGTGNPQTISAKFSASSVTGDLWNSYLVNISQYCNHPSAAAGVALNVANGTYTTGNSGYFTVAADRYDANGTGGGANARAAIGYYGGGNTATTGLAQGTTYLMLAKFIRVNQTTDSTNRGYAYLWVLNAAQYDNFKAGGITEAELTAAAIGTGSSNVTARQTSYISSGSLALDATKYLTLAAWGSTAAGALAEVATIDEIRYGTTMADVIPTPEPATLVLAALGMFGLLRRRLT